MHRFMYFAEMKDKFNVPSILRLSGSFESIKRSLSPNSSPGV